MCRFLEKKKEDIVSFGRLIFFFFLQILFTDHYKACICIDGQIFCYWQCDETIPDDTVDADIEDVEPQSTTTPNGNE